MRLESLPPSGGAEGDQGWKARKLKVLSGVEGLKADSSKAMS
jgi:hypothetical protein